MAPSVLVACEFSGRLRDAFIANGCNAVSCDLLSSESHGPHVIGDVLDIIDDSKWDLVVAHPPCTHLCVSGARWFKDKRHEQREALTFFMLLATCRAKRLAIENPVGIMSRWYRKPDQIIEPYWFGDNQTKATCLWLKRLPLIIPTRLVVPATKSAIHHASPGADRWKIRSRIFHGMADAMAKQWTRAIVENRTRCRFCNRRACYCCPDCGGMRTWPQDNPTCKCEAS